ncbi:hypothetical protein [Bradyrhizobium sp.]|uniref:hypothetical protein n=1 Tax=Bradyrhizobium sp. TaxID=376 RepID=UPI003C68DCF7
MTVMLQRLAALRRRREQRALEALTVQTGLLRRAERQAEDAARAVQDHIRDMRTRERALIGALAGHPASTAAILRIQLELDGADREGARRRAAEAQAEAGLQPRRSARAASLADFQLQQRATSKVNSLGQEQLARQTRHDTALGEAEAEDHGAAGGRAALTTQLNTTPFDTLRGSS